MSNKSNKNNQANTKSKGNTAVKKKDRTWVIYVTIGAVALVGIILLAVFAGGGSTQKVNGQQKTPSQQTTTLPDCCQ